MILCFNIKLFLIYTFDGGFGHRLFEKIILQYLGLYVIGCIRMQFAGQEIIGLSPFMNGLDYFRPCALKNDLYCMSKV